MDVLFLIDGSGSVGQSRFDATMDFVEAVTDSMDIRPGATRVALVQYSHTVRTEFEFISDRNQLKSSFSEVNYLFGGTFTGYAMATAYNRIIKPSARTNATMLFIVVTDGFSYDNVLSPADFMRSQGINMFSVAYGGFNYDQLLQIANEPDEDFVYTGSSPVDLYKKASRLSEKICSLQEIGDIRKRNKLGFEDIDENLLKNDGNFEKFMYRV